MSNNFTHHFSEQAGGSPEPLEYQKSMHEFRDKYITLSPEFEKIMDRERVAYLKESIDLLAENMNIKLNEKIENSALKQKITSKLNIKIQEMPDLINSEPGFEIFEVAFDSLECKISAANEELSSQKLISNKLDEVDLFYTSDAFKILEAESADNDLFKAIFEDCLQIKHDLELIAIDRITTCKTIKDAEEFQDIVGNIQTGCLGWARVMAKTDKLHEKAYGISIEKMEQLAVESARIRNMLDKAA